MTFRWLALAPLVFGVLSAVQFGCAPPLGRVLVTVVFENETRTQCIKSSARNASGASINSNPSALPRDGKDTLRIGLGETADLVGEVQVTISRFSTADCAGTAFDTETQSVNVVRGAPIATLEFRFVGMTDGGMDGGMDAGADAGVDAGCDVGACGNAPSECEVAPAVACNNDGGCRYAFRVAQTPCGDGGVCNSMGACLANVCAVLPAGSMCDDGLPCTLSSACSNGVCQGSCAAPPLCKLPMPTPSCDPNNTSLCELLNAPNLGNCGAANFCLSGNCVPWVPFTPMNFPFTLETVPYPTAAWNLTSPDGGLCDTVISTQGTSPMALQGDCGSPSLTTSAISDAGVMVITATSLDIGPNARLHFVGDKPVQLLVLGNASIRGVISVAPLLAGQQQPAGSASTFCTTPSAGSMLKEGGGGGGFGGSGGNGGEGMRSGGGANPTLTPFRGGCPGAGGFLLDGGVSAPGLGGGAIHLIVSDNLTLDGGIVTASGGGGAGGVLDNEGAAGGGSGGTVILEARVINLTNGAVTANGGGGGEGGDSTNAGIAGALGPINSLTGTDAANGPGAGGTGGTGGDDAQPNGGVGNNGGGARGGGGGGGAAGVIFVRVGGPSMSCKLGSVILSGVQGAQGMSITCTP